MLTISEYARALGVSHQYISKLVKKGMPLTCSEAADVWREVHASSKASTSPTRITRIMNENGSESSIDSQPRKRASKDKLGHTESTSESELLDALINARRAADEAWRLLRESMIEGRTSKIQMLLNIHNKAVEARFRAEIVYREELERRRVLIPLAEAMEMARSGLGVIISRLKALPQNVAARCSPTDANRAMTVLESECTAILTDAKRVYTSWSDDSSSPSAS